MLRRKNKYSFLWQNDPINCYIPFGEYFLTLKMMFIEMLLNAYNVTLKKKTGYSNVWECPVTMKEKRY